jgi:hypothetical protein
VAKIEQSDELVGKPRQVGRRRLAQKRKTVCTRIEPTKRERLIAYADAQGVSVGRLIDAHAARMAARP